MLRANNTSRRFGTGRLAGRASWLVIVASLAILGVSGGVAAAHVGTTARASADTYRPALHAVSPLRRALFTERYTDPTGDAKGKLGLDITSVVITENDKKKINFFLSVPSQKTRPTDAAMVIWVNTDLKTSTGQGGWDVQFCCGRTGTRMYRWNGSAWTEPSPAPALKLTYASGWSLDILESDLGSNNFQFAAETFDRAPGADPASDVTEDRAPDSGSWSFKPIIVVTPPPPPPPVKPPPPPPVKPPAPPPPPAKPQLKITRERKQPDAPIAGQRFTFSVAVVVASTGKPIPYATSMACQGRLVPSRAGLRRFKPFFDGETNCQWAVPPGAAGSRFQGSVRVGFKGSSVSRPFNLRVVRQPETLELGFAAFTPAQPIAGQELQASLSAGFYTADRNRRLMKPGAASVSCAARIGSSSIGSSSKLYPTGPVCRWSIPKNASGKKLAIVVTLRSEGKVARKSFEKTIR